MLMDTPGKATPVHFDQLSTARTPTLSFGTRFPVSLPGGMPRWVLALVLGLIMLAPPSFAQGSTGAVTGQVVDADGLPLPGAAVTVAGTTLSTRTDVAGRFELGRVPSGNQVIEVSYLGFESAEQEVQVSAGTAQRVKVSLDQPTVSDAVTVRASPILQGQARALNQQRTASNIQNIVSSDQFGRFPDTNSAEATQRIPGITLQRDQGEGRYVIVRGTEARLNSMTVNGERIPSPEGGVRQVALDVIPADLLEAIEVSKALTPDMDGDAIGGAVNLVTQRAPEVRRLSLSLAGGHNDITEDGLYRGQVVWGQRFADGKVGLLLSGSTMETDRGSQNFEVEYDGGDLEELQLRDYTVTRDRDGINADLDVSVNESTEIRFHGLWNDFGDQEYRRTLVNKVGDGELERELKDRFEVQEIQAAALEGDHLVSGTLVDWRLSWAYAEEAEPNRVDSLFLQEDVGFDPNVSPGSIDPDDVRANPLNQDLAAFELDGIVREDNLTTEEDVVLSVNAALPYFRDSGLSGIFKLGAKHRAKEKDRDNNVFEFDTDNLALLDVADGFTSPGFFNGRYDVGRFQSPRGIRDFAAPFELERDLEEEVADYDVSEDTTAAYGLVDLQLGDQLSLLTGVRWESTDADFDAFEVVFDEEGDFAALNPVSGSSDYDEILPSAHLRYALDERSNVRFSVSRSLARPNFEDLPPAELVLEEDGEIERGNPALDVTTAWNVDLMYEKYFTTIGVFSAGIFYKSIQDPIYRFTFEELRGGEEFDVIQPANGEDAEISGFELVYQNQLRNLEGWLSGLGLYLNYTYTDSEATFPNRADSRFPGQAESVGNVAVSYEQGGFSGRLSLNFHDEYISEVGDSAAEDLWVDEHVQLDFSATQRLTDRLSLFLEAVNLTDEPFRVYEGTPDRPIQEEIYSWWATLGLKVDF